MSASPIPATGVAWNEAVPDNGQPHGNDYNEHHETKKAVRIRMAKEHVTFAGSSVGGEHKSGSAVIYVGDYSSAAAGDDLPTTKPDGATALDADDAGRLAYDTDATYGGIYYKWDGSAWAAIDFPFTNIASATKDEDNMASNSDVHVPTQQSVVAYVATQTAAVVIANSAVGTSDINTASTSYVDMTDMAVTLSSVPAGADVEFKFEASFRSSSAGQNLFVHLLVDTGGGSYVSKREVQLTCAGGGTSDRYPCPLTYLAKSVVGGTVRGKIQWKAVSGTKYQDGSVSDRTLIVTAFK